MLYTCRPSVPVGDRSSCPRLLSSYLPTQRLQHRYEVPRVVHEREDEAGVLVPVMSMTAVTSPCVQTATNLASCRKLQ